MIGEWAWTTVLAAAGGWLVGSAAGWLDGRLDIVLDRGLAAAIRAPAPHGCDPAPRSWLKAAAAAWLAGPALTGGAPWGAILPILALFAGLFLCGWLDWRHRILPDIVVLPMLAAGLAAAIAGYGLVTWEDSMFGAMVGWFAPAVVGRLGRASGGGLGKGDIKFVAAIGAWTGPMAVCVIFCLSAMAMGLLLLRQSGRACRAPFGPVLALAVFLYAIGSRWAAGYITIFLSPITYSLQHYLHLPIG